MKETLLNETGNRNVFKVPEKYFENLEMQLEKRLDALETEKRLSTEVKPEKNRKFVLTMTNIRPMLYMAAMFILMVFSIGLVINYTSDKSSNLKAEEITTERIPTAEDYLISSLGTYGITQYYVETQKTE
jgi:hypothetical protein